MISDRASKGAAFVWIWGNKEIEKPHILKVQLDEIHSRGFSSVMATLGITRYELVDKKVVRAVTQASQWARCRDIEFWFQPDPRHASRSLIDKTGERTQLLIVTENSTIPSNQNAVNLTRVKNNQFTLYFHYPQFIDFPLIQELSLHFDPLGLERAFLFKMNDGVIVRDSICDITSETRFFAKLSESTLEVFGEIRIPEKEEWWVVTFPKFNTNLYDYAGRESNDLLHHYVENLFEEGAYIDGISWSEAGYYGDIGRFPVSLSIYNSFKAEYGYDLRDVLYGLVLNLDDHTHIRIRCDYYHLLMDLALRAKDELHEKFHSFFGNLEVGLPYTFHTKQFQEYHSICKTIDPWRSLDINSNGMTNLNQFEDLGSDFINILSMLIITKSLGIFSGGQKAYCSFNSHNFTKGEINYLTDLMGLFSIRWLVDSFNSFNEMDNSSQKKSIKTKHLIWTDFTDINHRLDTLRQIINYHFPIANTLLVFPVETIMNAGQEDAGKIFSDIYQLIGRLFLNEIQLDVISPWLLKDARFTADGLNVKGRLYHSMIYPYPEILSPEILELVSIMDKYGFPIFFGGVKPLFTTQGKRIPHRFPVAFELDDDYSWLWKEAIISLLLFPKNGMGTVIQDGNEIFFLICPKNYHGVVEGALQYQNHQFSIPKISNLSIFRCKNGHSIEKVF